MDALIVGGRCAGATLGILLARQGKRVLIAEKADMPSDQPMSTHFLGSYGMERLDELGVGDRVRAVATPFRTVYSGLEDAIVRLDLKPGREGTCARRYDVDAILLDEARGAGAEVRVRTKVVGLLRDGERVVGAVVSHAGRTEEIRASLVVGCDGHASTVAELVGAKEYNAYQSERAAFWTYFRRPAWFDEPPYDGAVAIIHYGDDYVLTFPVNADQVLVGVVFKATDLPNWQGDRVAYFFDRLRAHPWTRPFASEQRLGKLLGVPAVRFFFRDAAGPGWALVGDAGLFKDPTPGFGMSDAFRDAFALAKALERGGDDALSRYWRERDVQSLELFEFARDMGTPGYNNALNRAVFRACAVRPDLGARIVSSVYDRALSRYAMVPPTVALRALLGELLRGRFRAVSTFLGIARRSADVARRLAKARAALHGA